MYLKDIKIIDLRRSKWIKEKSDPKKGVYEFTKKVYLTKKDYFHEASRPPFVLTWCAYNPTNQFRMVRDWQIKYKATFVTPNDPYVPEGVPLDAEGKYVFAGDSVLMKIPLEVHLAKTARDVQRADRATYNRLKEYKDLVRAAGGALGKEAAKELEEQISKLGV